MKAYPPVPHVEDAPPALFASGHLWLQELIDGEQLRIQLRDSGVLRFGNSRQVFHGDVPPPYRHAVRHVRETLDRDALRAAVEDVETVVLVAESTHRQAVPYDFARMPPVLGLDVWDADREAFLAPDAVERVFDRLGLATVNTYRREVRATDFDPTPDAIPESAWYDGPAAGLVIRNKTGDVAMLPNPDLDLETDHSPLDGDADALAGRLATDDRCRRVADGLPADREPTYEAVFERVYEAILREHHAGLAHHETGVDRGAFKSAVGRRVREWLAERT